MAEYIFDYSVEVGVFNTDGSLVLRRPDLVMPLVKEVIIGRASDSDEDISCRGDVQKINGAFHGRACYDGKKIIIPQSVHGFTNWVSRVHGELVLCEDIPNFYYKHLSTSGMETIVYDDAKSQIVERMVSPEGTYNLEYGSDSEGRNSVCLLLGPRKDITTDNLASLFIGHGYYVRIVKKGE